MESEAGGMVPRGTLDTAACGEMAEQTPVLRAAR